MKKVLAIWLCVTLLAAIFAADAGALTENNEDGSEQGMTVNRYEEAFTRFLPAWRDICTYEEVYHHTGGRYETDWVLVRTAPLDPVTGDYYGVFDDIVLYSPEHYPFDFGYGVYDVEKDAYYSVTNAWDMGYTDLHEVFLTVAEHDASVDQLGDADMDHQLTIIDVTVIQRYLVGIRGLEECSWWFEFYGCHHGTGITSLADYDGDGTVTIFDATLIQRSLVGIERYPHDLTVAARIEREGSRVVVRAYSSFGEEPVRYRYTIEGTVHAQSVYGSDFGRFSPYDEEGNICEPGEIKIATGYITDTVVELPVTSLTYGDSFTLKITAKDADGKVSRTAVLRFNNVY